MLHKKIRRKYCQTYFVNSSQEPRVLLLYLYSINSVICRLSDHTLGKPRAEIRTRDERCRGRNSDHYCRPPYLITLDHRTSIENLHTSYVDHHTPIRRPSYLLITLIFVVEIQSSRADYMYISTKQAQWISLLTKLHWPTWCLEYIAQSDSNKEQSGEFHCTWLTEPLQSSTWRKLSSNKQ